MADRFLVPIIANRAAKFDNDFCASTQIVFTQSGDSLDPAGIAAIGQGL